VAVTRLEHAYAGFLQGTPAALVALLADTVVYHLPGAHLGGGRLAGRDAMLHRLAKAAVAFDAPPQIELLSVFGDDAFVVSIERFRAARAGRQLAQRVCVVWRFEGQRCVEIWSHFEDQAACDAFWAGWRCP